MRLTIVHMNGQSSLRNELLTPSSKCCTSSPGKTAVSSDPQCSCRSFWWCLMDSSPKLSPETFETSIFNKAAKSCSFSPRGSSVTETWVKEVHKFILVKTYSSTWRECPTGKHTQVWKISMYFHSPPSQLWLIWRSLYQGYPSPSG